MHFSKCLKVVQIVVKAGLPKTRIFNQPFHQDQ